MCDISVFIKKNDGEEKVLENVDRVEEVIGGGIRLINIFGEEETINARMILYSNSEKKMVFAPV